VVTIFLDAERFLEEAIESVLAQTFDDWELILVDDGSTDGSTRIARTYADRWPARIRYISHPHHANLGMSASRNAGIDAARGEFLAFLDADDVYRPEKLERQVAILSRTPEAAMVYGASEHWYSWTGRAADRARDCRRRLGVPPDSLVTPPRLVPLFITLEAQTPGTCGILVRRQAAEAVGGFERRFRGMFEDQAFLFKLCLASPVFVESGSWDRYRRHPASHSRLSRARGDDYSRRPSASHRAFLEWLEAYLDEERIDDPQVRRALAGALFPYRHPIAHALKPAVAKRRARERASAARGWVASVRRRAPADDGARTADAG
jgi:glycosyltransferase involved in cell wall biosynthesis